MTAVVFDKSGKILHGLGPADVELLEDGVKQDVTYFREASSQGDPQERVPLSVALALDNSGSMKQSLHFLQEAVLNFVYKLDEVDQALLVNFNESVKGSAEFTGDRTGSSASSKACRPGAARASTTRSTTRSSGSRTSRAARR